MKQPFFSILLPTKNRSEIVGGAIQSALSQTFGDFELIVSDNDDSETATREAVAKVPDARVRYFRTSGKLAMHENWENALRQASGRHVLILEDKMRLVPNALAILHKILSERGDVVVSYDIRFTGASTMPELHRLPQLEVIPSTSAAELFRRFSLKFFKIHPKSLDSCAPLEVIRRAKASSPTGLFYSHVTPDYSSGFLLLRTVREIYFLDAHLAYVPNHWMSSGRYSVGQASYHKAALTARWLKELPVSIEEIQSYSPVKCQWLWINNAMYDYFTKYQKPLGAQEPDWVCFHAFCCLIVLMGRRMGADMSEDWKAIQESLNQKSLGFRLAVYWGAARFVSGLGLKWVLNRLR